MKQKIFFFQLDSSQEVKLHPSSVMFGFKPELVIFYQLMATQKSYIKDLSLVDPVISFCFRVIRIRSCKFICLFFFSDICKLIEALGNIFHKTC